ncbi:stage II sporulation protein E [Clostridium sp. D2Q-11]|uniref:Stage II sporulation protein E n=1 Tax=Anaeromonas frigoriresistens TaxID=2683708 RepID=A0A942UU97_9FIRM|nr:stage II sporulation protein E [Anaeromonas frigoriresistens]MBS4537580.1 stage II sporulation protein E [Anaeromonas frigoriresistens]
MINTELNNLRHKKRRRWASGLLIENIHKRSITHENIILFLIAFFIARASIMDNLTPFGIAFISSYATKKKSKISVLIAAMFGMVSIHGVNSYQYIIPMILIYFIINVLRHNKSNMSISIISASVLVLFRSVILLGTNFYMYDLMIYLFEGIAVFALTFIFTYSINALESSKDRLFTNEEMISAVIMISVGVAGIGEISLLGLSIMDIVGVFLILFFSYTRGITMGTVIGVNIGLISSMSQVDMPYIISIYAIAGLLSGVFKDIGRIGIIIGFALGNVIMSFYINGLSQEIIGFKEMILASIIFLLLSNYISKFGNRIIVGSNRGYLIEDVYSNRIKDMTFRRLKEFSTVFKELSDIFKKVSEREKILEENDTTKFMDSIASKTCINCSMHRVCWENDFYNTYHSVFNLINKLENKGYVTEDDLPQLLDKRCIKPEKLIETMNQIFNIYKLNYKWEKKILESRQLVSQQLDGVSSIIKDLAKEIYTEIRFKEEVERAIYSELKKEDIPTKEITVTESQDGKFEIYIDLNITYNKERMIEKVIAIASEVVGYRLIRDRFSTSDLDYGKGVKFKLIKSNRYNSVTKVARYHDNNNYISGDSYTFGERQNNYYAVLSDGMGRGEKAKEESSVAINLLEKFLEAGYDKELALRTINSILVLKSSEEVFTTIDMSVLDLYKGNAQFIKIGSAPTFIKKKDRVEIINSNTLPVGILKEVDFNIYESNIEDGDFIIMMSDGILDSNASSDDKESWMSNIINNINNGNPQIIADEILDESINISEENNKDDMTVLVTKVWKKR